MLKLGVGIGSFLMLAAIAWMGRGDPITVNPFRVLVGRHGYGLSPEEETTHAQWWALVAWFAFAVGAIWN